MVIVHQPKTSGSSTPPGGYDSGGVFRATVWRIVRVAGPASYATKGIPVDLSPYFSRIVRVKWQRTITDATGETAQGRSAVANEVTPTDVFTAAKFRALVYRGSGHTHTYDKANTPTSGPSGAPTGLGSDNAHTHAQTYTATASGAASATQFGEEGNGTNLAGLTFELVVEGVPL